MAKIYKVELLKQEREELLAIIKKGKHTSQTYRNAYVLLNTDEGKYSEKIGYSGHIVPVIPGMLCHWKQV